MANRNIDTEMWNDPLFVDEFTPEDKFFWLFLLTTRYGNLSGVFEVSYKQMARDMGYSEESIKNLIYRFETMHKRIKYNVETKEMFIFNWYKYNWNKSPLFEKALNKHVDNIKCLEFKELVLNMYEELKENDRVSIPYQYHTNTVSNNNTNINTYNEETNLKLDYYVVPKLNPKYYEELFEEFWKAYPRKESKGQALKTFIKLKPTSEDVDKWIKHLALLIGNNWQGRDVKHIPHASTWLNARGFEDEIIRPNGINRNKTVDDSVKQEIIKNGNYW